MATISHSQVIVDENFNGNALPSGWTSYAFSGSHNWSFGSGDVPGAAVDFTTNAAIFDDDAAGDTGFNNHAGIYVGPLDLSTYSNVVMTYKYALNVLGTSGENLKVTIEDNSNGVLIALKTYDADTDPTDDFIDISAAIAANPGVDPSAVFIDFIYDDNNSGWNWGAGIDDVLIINTPSYNLCAAASGLTVGTTFDSNNITVTNEFATASGETPTPSCGSFGSGEDVWFTAVVPSSGNIAIETKEVSGSILDDTVMSVYSGSCGALTEIECNDDSGEGLFSKIELTGQTPGAVLKIRVFEFNNNAQGVFQISAYDGTLGVSENDIVGLSLYPNPIKDVLNVNAQEEITKLSVYNLLGQVVKVMKPSSSNFSIDLSSLPVGIYIVKAETNDKTSSIRVIKQ